MRVLIAPDKFKGCMDAGGVAEAIASGWRRTQPQADIRCVPMGDGGEGTLDVLTRAADGQLRRLVAAGPLGEPRETVVALIDHARTAVIELARICGMALLKPARYDPMNATTLGVGQAIAAVLEADVERVVVALGGSASVDGGIGLMQGLGLRCLDACERELPPGLGGGRLSEVCRFEFDNPSPLERLRSKSITILTDVLNPLLGPHGAARVFGPQKGATPEEVAALERGLSRWVGLLEFESGLELRALPGMGAAGGTAAPLIALAGAVLEPGVDYVMQAVGLTAHVAWADVVITGEGRLDGQSCMGKVVSGVGRLARSCGKPCMAVVGDVGPGVEQCEEFLDGWIALTSLAPNAAAATTQASHWLATAGEQLAQMSFD